MEQQRLFEMLFRNAMRTQQNTARVAPMPRAKIIKMPVEPNYPTYSYRSTRQSQRWQEQLLPQTDQNLYHDPRTDNRAGETKKKPAKLFTRKLSENSKKANNEALKGGSDATASLSSSSSSSSSTRRTSSAPYLALTKMTHKEKEETRIP